MKNRAKNKAFTLIEMLWVLMIVAILLSISVVSFRHSQAKARDVIRKTDLQTIADALISYANDHGHFPSSIYDNWQALTISQALNMVADWWIYNSDTLEYYAYMDSLPYMSWVIPNSNLGDANWWGGGGGQQIENIIDLESLIAAWETNKGVKELLDTLSSIFENAEKSTPIETEWLNNPYETMNYSIVTQGMCVSLLKKYLVNEWYISTIPSDPSWESVNLQTNICANKQWWNIQGWVNANDTGRSIQWSNCYANTNFWCTQICKEWYVYVSDWEHFALIAHMENENGWNYETTSCWSCEIAWQCKHTEGKSERTSTDQLPCDITDEFKNTFECIQENWVVEYSTWEYYFYIY